MRALSGYGGLLLAVLLWGGSYPVGHALAAGLSPLVLTTWRFTAAAAVMTGVARLLLGPAARIPRPLWPRVAAMGLLGHAAFSLCFFGGIRQTEPAVAAVLAGLEPAAAILLAAVVGRQAVRPAVWMALALSAAGAALAALPAAASPGGGWLGPALLLLATACFGAYTYLGAEVVATVSPAAMAAATMRWSLPPLWIATLWLEPHGLRLMPTVQEAIALAYFVGGVTILAFLGWNVGLRALGLNRAAVWGNAIPVAGLGFSALAGQPPTAWQWLGMGLVVAGIAWIQRLERVPSVSSKAGHGWACQAG